MVEEICLNALRSQDFTDETTINVITRQLLIKKISILLEILQNYIYDIYSQSLCSDFFLAFQTVFLTSFGLKTIKMTLLLTLKPSLWLNLY